MIQRKIYLIDETKNVLTKHAWLLKLFALVALGGFWVSAMESLKVDSDRNFSTWLLVINETVTILLIILARRPKTINLDVLPVLFAILGTMHILFVRFDQGQVLVSPHIAKYVMIFGLLFTIVSKLYLGRSFGIIPANRGVKKSGPYKLVRHPIYLGYLIVHIGFLVQNFSTQNLLVYCAVHASQIARIFYEERNLSEDLIYQDYKKATKWRLIPFVF